MTDRDHIDDADAAAAFFVLTWSTMTPANLATIFNY